MAINYVKNIVWPVLILAFTYQGLGELYELFNDDVTHKVNWILFKDRSMTLSWNVKYLTEELNRILEATAFFLAITDRKFKERRLIYCDMARLYLTYRSLDILFYFINFKTDRYWIIFIMLIAFETYYKRKSIK